jgi:hypothetical protein
MNLECYGYTPGDRGGSSVGQSSGLMIRWTPFRSVPPCAVTCGSVRARLAQRSDVGQKFLHGFLHAVRAGLRVHV